VKILIVDDDPKIRSFVSRGLQESGIECESAEDGESALARLRGQAFDLVLLDVMLPGIQGWDVLAELRREGRSVPVIWVTARDGVDERVKGLQLGGDDYVVKPFAFAELLARIQAVRRRHALSEVRRVADLEIDPVANTVRRGGRVLDLTRMEYTLLRRLAEGGGRPVSRGELLKTVWNIEFDPGTNVVDVHVRRLRRKIEDDPDNPRWITTVRGVGYRFEP
jgi:two-component system copper resistance phosphate regulon response regulator CusR